MFVITILAISLEPLSLRVCPQCCDPPAPARSVEASPSWSDPDAGMARCRFISYQIPDAWQRLCDLGNPERLL